MNPLRQWMSTRDTGRGVWKWSHYLDIYHDHLKVFRGTDVTILEVGVYSGGSLDMWREYFGDHANVVGVDIEPACRKFDAHGTKIFVGDQGDAKFWEYVKSQVPRVDVVVDDGSHDPVHQRVTMEALLPHLSPGGVYICEDLLNDRNRAFGEFVAAMSVDLHENVDIGATDMLAMGLTELQRAIKAVHVYPHVVVIEKWLKPPERFEAPAYGTEWIWTDPLWGLREAL